MEIERLENSLKLSVTCNCSNFNLLSSIDNFCLKCLSSHKSEHAVRFCRFHFKRYCWIRAIPNSETGFNVLLEYSDIARDAKAHAWAHTASTQHFSSGPGRKECKLI